MIIDSPLFEEWIKEERKRIVEKVTIEVQINTTKKNLITNLSEKFDFIGTRILEKIMAINDIVVLEWLLKKIIKVETLAFFDALIDERLQD